MRQFDKRRYILAFIITAAIFFLGFFFGFLMDLQRSDYFQNLNRNQQLDIRGLQIQNDLMQDKDLANQCPLFRYVFDNSITELENNRARLELYNEQANINKDEFEILRREYTLSQINFWLISKKLKASCSNSSDFVTVLYFFSDKEKCPDCDRQASVLDYYKSNLKQNLLIFAIDEKLAEKESVVKLLLNTYDVKSYPTMIIENETREGYVGKEDMKEVFCKFYKTNTTTTGLC